MNVYIYAPYPAIDETNEIVVIAENEKEAHKKAFNSLTDDQKNSISEIELVDIVDGVEAAK